MYLLDGSSPDIRPMGDVAIKDGRIAYKLPPLSAALFACEK